MVFSMSVYADDSYSNFISVAEGISIAEEVFGKVDNLDIDKRVFKGDYTYPLTFETAAEILLKINGYSPFDTSLWYDSNHFRQDVYWTNFVVRGYPVNEEPYRSYYWGVSREDYNKMVNYMLGYNDGYFVDYQNDIDIKIKAYNNAFELSDEMIFDIKSELLKIDSNIVDSFIKDNGVIYVVSEEDWVKRFSNEFIGYFLNNTIYIRGDNIDVITHEMGHYLETKVVPMGFRLQLTSKLKEDANSMWYDTSNRTLTYKSELFAEGFRCYCTRGEMAMVCPTLYKYIDSAVDLFNKKG